jgi:lipopolysaccharide transport system permease protein
LILAPASQAAALCDSSTRPLSAVQLLSDLFPIRQRALIWQFTRRDVQARYRGSLLGLAWSFLTPLLMLAVYTFVFREVLKARWPGGDDSPLEFALRVYAGLIVFNLFSELVSRAPMLVTGQPNLVKKVVFPLEIAVGGRAGRLVPGGAQPRGAACGAAGRKVTVLGLAGPAFWSWPLSCPFVGLGWLLASLGCTCATLARPPAW